MDSFSYSEVSYVGLSLTLKKTIDILYIVHFIIMIYSLKDMVYTILDVFSIILIIEWMLCLEIDD